MANEVAKIGGSSVPAFAQGKTSRIGNLDSSDLIVPRIKLLQATSPEVTEIDGAKLGEFWHNIMQVSLGKTLLGIPIMVRKSQVLWAPRGDDRGVLARSLDGIHWDKPAGTKFTVRPKKAPAEVTYVLGEKVNERVDGFPALTEFGSSIPGNANSPPAAALTYNMMWYFPEIPEMSPGIIINTRSSIRPCKALLSQIDAKPVDCFGQLYEISTKTEKGEDGPYLNYQYAGRGYVQDEAVFELCKGLHNTYKDESWRADDEEADVDSEQVDTGTPREQTEEEKAARKNKKF